MNRALVLAALLIASPAAAQAPACRAASDSADPHELLARAARAMGVDEAIAAGRALHFHFIQADAQPYQSDRYYPPFFDAMRVSEHWYDPATGLSRADDRRLFPRQGPPPSATPLYVAGRGAFAVRDSDAQMLPPMFAAFLHADRMLNPWAVIHDWQQNSDEIRVEGVCPFRDDDRIVLVRRVADREERLFLDRDSGLPVKLDFESPQYLWGQVRTEVLYSVWIRAGEGIYPAAAHILDDGQTRVSRTVGTIDQVARADAAIPEPPATLASAAVPPLYGGAIASPPVDTVRVADDTFLLVNPLYTEAVTLQRDTVFLLDATIGEERARQDSAWIARLFPGDHPVVVLVTDLAWPHIAGVRSWVAMGATIASHPAFEPFLRRVVEREWTLAPDLLERRRAAAEFRFRPVTDGSRFASGAIHVHTIDGIGSENALMAWIPAHEFLWAGDFVQLLDRPTQYASEVRDAAARAGIAPARVAAQHIPLTPWSRVIELNPPR